jgi:hypothetical protein
MKKFIIRTLLFLAPILIIGIVLEVSIRNIPNDYKYKKEYLDANAGQIETLILGSSETFRGVNPDYFSTNAFNAANNAQSLEYDYKILNMYKDSLKNLKTLIIPISYPTYYFNLKSSKGSRRIKYYNIYFGMTSSFDLTEYSEVLSNKIKYSYQNFVTYYINGNTLINCSTLGWTNQQKGGTLNLIDTGLKAARNHSFNINSTTTRQYFGKNLNYLESIIQWAAANDVEVILFTPPAYKSYTEALNPEQIRITIETSEDMASKYDNCVYLNKMTDPNFDIEDFYDANHLSGIGAQKLTLLLDKKQAELLNNKSEN